MRQFIIIAAALLCVLLLVTSPVTAAKKRKSKKSSTVDETEIQFTTKEDLDAKMAKLNAEQRKKYGDETDPAELAKLAKEEKELQKDVIRAELNHGKFSAQRAKALHAYGRNVYKQGRFDQVLQVSKDIVRIHEEVDGVDHINTGNALGNVGSVAFRLENAKLCEIVMTRALYIVIKEFGKDSKEVRSSFPWKL